MLNYGGLGLGLLFTAKDMASGVMQNVERNLRSVSDTADAASRKWESSFRTMRTGLMGLGMGGAIAGSLTLVGRAAFKAASEFEVYQMQFETMLGSAKRAKEVMADLARFAATTPYEIPEIVQAGKLLTTFGMDYTKYLRDVGDLVAAFGGSGERLLEVVTALGRLKAGQFGEAFETFRRFGISYQDWEKAGLRFNEKNKQFLGTAEEAMAAFGKVIQMKGFSGMMEKLSKTSQGIISNIKDAWGSIIRGMGVGFLEQAKDAFRDILKTLNSIDPTKIGEALGKGFGDLLKILRPVFRAALEIVRAFARFVETRPKVASFIITLMGVSAAVLTVVSGLMVMKGLLGLLPAWLGKLGLAGKIAFGPLLGAVMLVTAVIYGLRYAYEKNLGGFAKFVNKMGLLWQGVGALIANTKFDPETGWVSELPEALRNELKKLNLLDIAIKIWMFTVRVREFLRGFVEGVRGFVKGLSEALKPIGAAFLDAGKAIVEPFLEAGAGLTRTASRLPVKSFRDFGFQIGKAFEQVLPFIRGFAEGFAGVVRTLGAIFGPVARVVIGAFQVLGKVILWVLDRFAKSGENVPTDKISNLGKAVGALAASFLALKGYTAMKFVFSLNAAKVLGPIGMIKKGILELPNTLLNVGAKFDDLAKKLDKFSLKSVITGFQRVRSAAASLPTKVIDYFRTLKDGAMLAGEGLRNFGRSLLGAGARALGFLKTLMLNPITLWVLAIVAVAAAVYLLWKNWDKVKAALGRVWEKIKEFANGLSPLKIALLAIFMPIVGIPLLIIRNWDKIKGFFAGLWSAIVQGGADFLKWIASLPGQIWGWLSGLPGQIGKAFGAAWSALAEGLNTMWKHIAQFFTSLPQQTLEWGKNLIVSFKEGILSAIGLVGDAVKNVAGAVKKFLGIESPAEAGPLATSHLWRPNLINMFAAGIKKGIPLITAASVELASALAGGMAAAEVPLPKIPEPEITALKILEIPAPKVPKTPPIKIKTITPEISAPKMPEISGLTTPQVAPVELKAITPYKEPQQAATPVSGVGRNNRRLVPAMPVRPVVMPKTKEEKTIPVVAKQAERPEIIQLVVDGRVLAEVVRNIEREDLARSAPW